MTSFGIVVTSNCDREYGSVVITARDLEESTSSKGISVKNSGNGSNSKFLKLSSSLRSSIKLLGKRKLAENTLESLNVENASGRGRF